jgi:hypothetical protein
MTKVAEKVVKPQPKDTQPKSVAEALTRFVGPDVEWHTNSRNEQEATFTLSVAELHALQALVRGK